MSNGNVVLTRGKSHLTEIDGKLYTSDPGAWREFCRPSQKRSIDDDPLSLSRKLGAGLLAAALIVGVAFRKRFTAEGFGLLVLMVVCYCMSLVPAISLGVDLFSTQGERFLYLPSAFACIAIVHLATIFVSRRRIRNTDRR